MRVQKNTPSTVGTVTADVIRRVRSQKRGGPTYLAAHEWMSDPLPLEVRRTYRVFKAHFRRALAECEAVLGPPAAKYPNGSERAPLWYPEFIVGAVWFERKRVVYLAAVHHDKETPVLLELGSLSSAAIHARSQ